MINSENVHVIELSTVVLQCDNQGMIHVNSARYGRDTRWRTVTGILGSKCDFQHYCTTPAENYIFSDPAPGEQKSLHAEYSCGKFSFHTVSQTIKWN